MITIPDSSKPAGAATFSLCFGTSQLVAVTRTDAARRNDGTIRLLDLVVLMLFLGMRKKAGLFSVISMVMSSQLGVGIFMLASNIGSFGG